MLDLHIQHSSTIHILYIFQIPSIQHFILSRFNYRSSVQPISNECHIFPMISSNANYLVQIPREIWRSPQFFRHKTTPLFPQTLLGLFCNLSQLFLSVQYIIHINYPILFTKVLLSLDQPPVDRPPELRTSPHLTSTAAPAIDPRPCTQAYYKKVRFLLPISTHFYPLLPTSTHFYPLLPASTHFYPFLPTSTHFYPLLPISTHFYPFLPTSTNFYPFLPTSTHFYPFLPTSTHFYPLLPISTHFYPFLPTSTHSYPFLPTFTHFVC